MSDFREPFGGRWWAIIDVEACYDIDPIGLFPTKDAAEKEIRRRRALPDDDDDRLTEYHQALPADVAGAIWNSYDPDPRADNPLDADEIAAVHRGDE